MHSLIVPEQKLCISEHYCIMNSITFLMLILNHLAYMDAYALSIFLHNFLHLFIAALHHFQACSNLEGVYKKKLHKHFYDTFAI